MDSHDVAGPILARPARRGNPNSRVSRIASVGRVGLLTILTATLLPASVIAQVASSQPLADDPPLQWAGVPVTPVPDVMVLQTADETGLLLRVVSRGLSHPWSLAFLPNGDILVTERDGGLRIVRDGVLDPEPIPGLPEIYSVGNYAGLLEVAVHPEFEDNQLVYMTYISADEYRGISLARARFDGSVLVDFEDLFRATPDRISVSGSRLLFAPDGTLFMPVGGAFNSAGGGVRAQDTALHIGKVLRLRDDGTVPDDNPFVDRDGYLPEIYSLGHRNPMGLAFHPDTGELWVAEHAPQGGDEVNIVLPGKNYGWPVVSYGRQYEGPRVNEQLWHDGFEVPVVVWIPSVAPSGMTFYTGDAFPAWRGNLFVGSLREGRIRRTGSLQRIVLNAVGEETARESILTQLHQRIRDVRQGPDGFLYLLTDEDDGVLMRIEPLE